MLRGSETCENGNLGVNKFFVINMCICFQVLLLQMWLKGLSISCTSFLGTFEKLQKYGVLSISIHKVWCCECLQLLLLEELGMFWS